MDRGPEERCGVGVAEMLYKYNMYLTVVHSVLMRDICDKLGMWLSFLHTQKKNLQVGRSDVFFIAWWTQVVITCIKSYGKIPKSGVNPWPKFISMWL